MLETKFILGMTKKGLQNAKELLKIALKGVKTSKIVEQKNHYI